jgi:hypothetical protein
MGYSRVLILALAAAGMMGQTAAEGDEENLRYNVNWPSGLSLGEGSMRTRRLEDGSREYSLVLDAAIPGVPIRDEYTARATQAMCSVEFEKKSVHGPRKASEKSAFDAGRNVMVRTTSAGGGKSEVPIAPCAKDALTFLHFLRREIGRGNLPSPQTTYFGAAYQIRVTYMGAQQVTVDGARVEADRIAAAVKGPASENSFEIFLGRDQARTPVLIKVPFALGTFSMELVR